jgi:peptidyl-prolyl cis-trans isomerase D
VTIDAVDRQGMRPDGTIIDNLPGSAELLQGAFEADAKAENQPINIGSTGFLFYEVESIEPAHDRLLDEVKDKAIADWKSEQATNRLQAKAEEAAKQVKDGSTLDAVATALNLEKQTKRGLKRNSNDPDFGQPGIAAAFGAAQNQSGEFEAPDGSSRVVFQVVESIEPADTDPSSIPDDLRRTFGNGMANDLIDQLVSRLRGEYDVEINQAAIERALSF